MNYFISALTRACDHVSLISFGVVSNALTLKDYVNVRAGNG